MKKISLLLASVLVAASAFCESSTSLSGAGATFPLPFYNMAFQNYTKTTGVKVSYGGIGSGGGIQSLTDKVVDFGASDAFMSNADIAKMPASVLHIPTCSGAVVIAFNLSGISQIKLNPETLTKIFLGEIKNWNDPALKRLNPTIKFPNLAITVVHRSDGSGTTNMFTDYLTKVSKEWATKLGAGKSVNWPTGIGAKGNPGVAGTISQTAGAIGYVGSEYAFAEKISSALLQNKAGKYIKASIASVSAAGKGLIPADTRVMITNSSAVDAYPISGFTWLILYKEQNYNKRSYEQSLATVRLLYWMVSPTAQGMAGKVNYSPLPAPVVAKAKAILRTVTYNGRRILK
jgi:phosphate transport system substrate-binding protein